MILTYKLKKTSEFIFDYLSDMQKFVLVHPIISKIDKTGNDSYLVHETLKLGSIPFSFTYPITLEKKIKEKIIIIRATVLKLTKIEMTFVLKTDDNYTIIEEIVKFKSPLPIKRIMESIFRKQHTQLFKNIELK